MVTSRISQERDKKLTHGSAISDTRITRITILRQQGSKNRRMCNERDETVMHILSECSKLAQTIYKKRHDKFAVMVH